MASYSCSPNSVYRFGFVLSKSLPEKPVPLYQQLNSVLLYRLVKEQPHATLKELCQRLKREQHITLSTTSMSRELRRIGLTAKARHKLSKETFASVEKQAA